MTNTESAPTSARGVPRGPHAGLVALSSLVLTVAGVALAQLLSSGQVGASPFGDPGAYATGIADHPCPVRLLALFQIGAAVPLAVFAAVVRVQLHRLGALVPGPVIGLTGGLLAAASLVVSGSATFAQASPTVAGDTALVTALGWLAFGAGGVGYAVGVGLLVAGVAVPSVMLGFLARPMALTGLLIALLSELAWLGLVLDPAQYLIPVARFAGGLWLVLAGFWLPRPTTTSGQEVPS